MSYKFKLLKIGTFLSLMSYKALHTLSNQGAASISSENSVTNETKIRTKESPTYDFQAIEADIGTAIESGKFPSAAFTIAKNGEIIHENALGWADKEKQIHSTAHTPYPLASVSKPIVATALMILHERGHIDLHTPAQNYAGNWLFHQPSESPPQFSLKQLLNHTAGLGTYARIYWGDQDHPIRSLKESVRKYVFLAQSPGTISEYSNLGYGLIGQIITEQSGTSLSDFLATEIFESLGMHNSRMIDSFTSPANAARKYNANGERLVDTYNDTPGAGNIYASAHDLALFGAFHLDNKGESFPSILSPQHKLLMRSFVDPDAIYPYYNASHYGLGWYFRTNREGETIVWHEGGMPGASTIIILLPERNIVATVMINATDVNSYAQAFANSLIQAVEPDYQAAPFDAIEGFDRFTNQPEFLGRWEGSIAVDGVDIPWALIFKADGSVRAEFPKPAANSLLPAEAAFPALIKGNLLVATLTGTLPASDVVQSSDGYVLLRLLRRGNDLSGTAVAYATPHRLEHLYPFSTRLHRKTQ